MDQIHQSFTQMASSSYWKIIRDVSGFL